MKENSASICPLCGGSKQAGTTTFTAELGFGVVVVRNVPALVCAQCGADWIADEVAARIEELVEDARKRRFQVEVTTLS
jgi:YgiT-type zinc finger domain-containing protein